MRKRSPATELRYAKVEIGSLKTRLNTIAEELKQRRLVGQMMSNICYNLAQNEAYDAQHRQSMKDCREAWDKIASARGVN